MGLHVNNTDSSKPDPSAPAGGGKTDFGRFGRPIATGKYECIVDKVNDEFQHNKDATLYGLEVTLRTVNASLEKAPEGQVKIGWKVFPKSASTDEKGKLLSDGSTLYEFCEAFDPRGNTAEGLDIDGPAYVGRKCYAYVNWNQSYKNGAGMAFVNKVIPIPGNQAPPVAGGAEAAPAEATATPDAGGAVQSAMGIADESLPF